MNSTSVLPLQILAMLFNPQRQTYHPIIFLHRPPPGGHDLTATSSRYKSHGCHEQGIANRDEAIKFARENWSPNIPGMLEVLNEDILWDGVNPAHVCFFGYVGNEFKRIL